jgi:hypothetical protein
MKDLIRFKYLRLILFVLIINFFSCADDKIKEHDVTVIQIVNVKIYDENRENIDGDVSGKINVEDLDGQKIEFNITTGDNTIELPFGFYKARVNDFKNYSSEDFNLLALGGNKVKHTNVAISVIPNYNVEILSIQPYSYGGYELLFKDETLMNEFENTANYKLWGSNEEEISNREIDQLQWRTMKVWNGQGRFGIDGAYKYYCVTPEPIYGYRDNREYKNWFKFIHD